jgi:PiT family inorganic phosphate transporter
MVLITATILVFIIIIIALIFDFTNGFHDSANAIATIVSTKVLTPKQAVLFAAFFNFIAAFGLGMAVASTISKIVKSDTLPKWIIPFIVLGGLIGAISWNLITWYLGLPSSSSHALIGGLTGSGIAAAGIAIINQNTLFLVVLYMVLSPLIGLVCGFLFMTVVLWACRKSSQAKVDRHFRKLQLVSAAAYSFSHGTNDAQKTIGIITPMLFSIGYVEKDLVSGNYYVPWEVILVAFAVIALGTLCGGWRIMKTMGHKITKLRPIHGFAAETASATTIIGATAIGVPVSTTHIISTSIMGVGATKRLSAVRWGVARKIVWAWILTIPISALIGYVSFMIMHLFM